MVKSPVDLHTAFTKAIIPQIRTGVHKVKVIEEEAVPQLAKIARVEPASGVRSFAEAGKMRIEYESGRRMEEEIYAAISQFFTDMPSSGFSGSYFINYWYIDYVFSF